MAKPWRKRSAWPYVSKKGYKTYTVGFYDHDKRERTRRFPSIEHAEAWMHDYVSAERRGRESLRRFLLDLDAKQASQLEERTIAQVLELYLELSCDPSRKGGLAPETFKGYTATIERHMLGIPSRRLLAANASPAPYALRLAATPAIRFNEPQPARSWRQQMVHEGVPRSTRQTAWQVLSAALSWAASSWEVPEIQTNGCLLASEPSHSTRRSIRAGGTGYRPTLRTSLASWVLSPAAVEAIRDEMLRNPGRRTAILAQRDAIIVSLQYGLGARNQEVFALRWACLTGEQAWIFEVLTGGQINTWGKTQYSTRRRTKIPSILQEDIETWRHALQQWGHPVRPFDFVIPGNLADHEQGTREPATGACHLSVSQAKRWGGKSLTPAIAHLAQQERFFDLRGATPYALRRGGIALRLRAQDPQTVARECGTSTRVLYEHYAFAIEDLRDHGPQSVDVEWRAARAEINEPKPPGASSCSAPPQTKPDSKSLRRLRKLLRRRQAKH